MPHRIEQHGVRLHARGRVGARQQVRRPGKLRLVCAKVGQAEIVDADQAKLFEVGVGEPPTAALVEPGPVAQHLAHRFLGVDQVGALKLRVDQPLTAHALFARTVEAQGLEDRNTQPVRRQALVASAADGAKERRAKEADEQEVVEVPGLKRRILAVVAEAQHLSAGGRHAGFGLAVHPAQDRVRQQSGCRGTPLRG